jgi:hypothetical protein
MDEVASQVTVEEKRQEATTETDDSDVSGKTPDPGAITGEIPVDAEKSERPESEKTRTIGTLDEYGIAPVPAGSRMFDRQQWFDLIRWAHNTPSLSREEKLRFVRLGRLLQKGRRLTHSQDEQVAELVSLAYSMGYKPR